jgi:hypothetical protein
MWQTVTACLSRQQLCPVVIIEEQYRAQTDTKTASGAAVHETEVVERESFAPRSTRDFVLLKQIVT